jgi:hypothetical protein
MGKLKTKEERRMAEAKRMEEQFRQIAAMPLPLAASFERLVRSGTDANIRNCLGWQLADAAKYFHRNYDNCIEEEAMHLARIVLLEENVHAKAAAILEYAAILAHRVLSEAKESGVELPSSIRAGLEQIKSVRSDLFEPEATVANQGGR